jgi:holliday junction DNA helicase RuvA
MIVKMTGKLAAVSEDGVVVDRDGMCYEVFIPSFALNTLSNKLGQEVTLHTIEYYEGSAMGGNMFPRLVGFVNPDDRAFFIEFIKVKGMGYKKALRALAQPVKQIALAIEQGDTKILSMLPEIGKRTADQLVASLKGKLDRFTWGGGGPAMAPVEALDQFQREALEVLVQLGERRNEAVDLIQKVCQTDEKLKDPAKIVEAVYKRKAGTI